MVNGVCDLRSGEKVFISYINDDNRQIDGYVTFISISNNLITFQTNQNIIVIPSNRLLKIKKEVAR